MGDIWAGTGRITAVDAFSEPEINELDMPVGVQQEVLWLQVAVDDAEGVVQKGEDEHDLGGVEARRGEGEVVGASQVREDLAAWGVLQLDL